MENFKQRLENRGFASYFVRTKKEIQNILDEEIPKEKSVAFGGSKTLDELGLYEFFEERGNKTNWHWRGDNLKVSDKADIYFSSSNAITLDGDFYFVDGNGNRLRNLTSEKERYIICGTNKIVENKEEAKKRVENTAAPLNVKRLQLDTPCSKTGKCQNCSHKDRICNYYLWIKRAKHRNIKIIFIEGDYGY